MQFRVGITLDFRGAVTLLLYSFSLGVCFYGGGERDIKFVPLHYLASVSLYLCPLVHG